MMKMLKLAALLLCCVCLMLTGEPPSRAYGDERIVSYDVTAVVSSDASMTVTERIAANVERYEIRHGIIRIFPVVYVSPEGEALRTGFEFLSATLDGSPVPFKTERRGGDVGIRVGDPDFLVPRGVHVWALTYRVTNHIRFLEDRDALYWNATGNDWAFPIDSASFTLELPGEGVKILASSAYTGHLGEAGADFIGTGPYSFATTRPLAEGEGFTVAFDWERGIVTQPEKNFFERAMARFMSNRLFGLALFPLVALIYFLPAWFFLGRDLRLGTVVPLFYPPDGMTPGYMALVRNMKALPAAMGGDIMELVVKGRARVERDEAGKLILRDAFESDAKSKIDPSLQALAGALFGKGDAVELVPQKLSGVWGNYKSRMENMGKRELYSRRDLASALGVLVTAGYIFLSLAALLTPASFINPRSAWGDACLFFVGLFFFFLLLRMGYSGLKKAANKALSWKRRALALFAAIIFLRIDAAGLYLMREDVPLAVAILSAAAIAFLFIRIMPVRSGKCVRHLAQVEGFLMYIEAAEKRPLAELNAPEDTVERYERILPYAIALGAAEAWERRFAPLLEAVDYDLSWWPAAGDRRGYVRAYSTFTNVSESAASIFGNSPFGGGQNYSLWELGSWFLGGGTSGGSSGGGTGGGGGRGW
ncbi:DUF2207 domain-containing protein [Synergistaceae bacterium OttesenSCG-928-I11]|nr:DUF2207 domain-containing protein [Synergistaceae bacterium OttesenSCG-928-I11]